MNLNFETKLAESYASNSQKARVLTEAWVLNEIYCPNCGDNICNYNNNKPVADFYCKKCSEDFELKSKQGNFVTKVPAGSYYKIIKRINSPQKPNFFFMSYKIEIQNINYFFVVPKYFFITEIIEKRSPLTNNAKRSGWIGSNILFSKIPKAGQIFYVENGKEIDKKVVLSKWQKTIFLKQIKKRSAKGWILDIMNCIDLLNKKEFHLSDIYNFEKDLSANHYENKNIKPKIRQQLQILRNKGYLEFLGNGVYKLS